MKQIRFRGKSIHNYNDCGIAKGQFVYGFYFQEVEDTNDGFSFEYNSYIRIEYGDIFIDIQVDESTVGQYIGLKDKNGMEIYEGDIIKISDTLHGVIKYNTNGCYFGIEYIGTTYLNDIKQLGNWISCYKIIDSTTGGIKC